MIKTLTFSTMRAVKAWEKENYPFVKVLSVSARNNIISFDSGFMHHDQELVVSYLQFPSPDEPA